MHGISAVFGIQLPGLLAGDGLCRTDRRPGREPPVLLAAAAVPGLRPGGSGGAGPARSVRENFFALALWGGAAATAVEFAVHWAYEAWLGVRFWDYGAQRWNLGGRVCLRFSLAWGALLALMLPRLEAVLAPLLEAVPPQVTFVLVLAVTADGVCTVRLLRRTRGYLPFALRPPGTAAGGAASTADPGTRCPGRPR